MSTYPESLPDYDSLLKERYISKMPSLILDIETQFSSIKGGCIDNVVEFKRKVHNLIGSSGTYGFMEVSHRARNLEDILINADSCGCIKDNKTLNKITSHLIALRSLSNRDYSSNDEIPTAKIDSDIKLRPLNILVASDDEDLKAKLLFDLTKLKHFCYSVDNGGDAVDIFRSNNIDLVIVEIDMPVLDGYQVVRQMKNIHKARHIPILFLTSSNRKNELIKCIECGGDDVIQKPYDIDFLHAKMFALDRLINYTE